MKNLLLITLVTTSAFAAPRFIGGRKAIKGEFEASVRISGYGSSCSAAKIGPRTFLTSAQCVFFESPRRMSFNENDSLDIENNEGVQISDYVTEVTVFPGFLEKTKFLLANESEYKNYDKSFRKNLQIYAASQSSDLAIFKVKKFSKSIPIAKVDLNPIAYNEKMIAGGFGCRKLGDSSIDGYYISEVTNLSSLNGNAEKNRSLSKEEILLGYDQIEINNLMFSYEKDKASACPGDSGSPVYRASNNSIIGVSSFISIVENTEKKTSPKETYNARLHLQAKWIKETTQNFGEVDSIIFGLDKKTCQSEIFYALLENNWTKKDVQNLCSRNELLNLEKSYQSFGLKRLDNIPGFNSQKFNKIWRELLEEARLQDSILKGQVSVPSDFTVTPSFYKDVVSSQQFSVFQKLEESKKLSIEQKKDYLQKNPQQLEQFLKSLGEAATFELINLLPESSTIFKLEFLWNYLKTNNLSLASKSPFITPKNLYKEGVSFDLMGLGYSIVELYEGGIGLKLLVSEKIVSKKELIEQGISYSAFTQAFSVKELLELGVPLNILKINKITVDQLIKESFDKSQIQAAGFTTKEAMSVSSVPELKRLGYLPGDFKSEGIPFQSIVQYYDAAAIVKIYSFQELYKAGVMVIHLINVYGMTPSQAHSENFSINLLYPDFHFGNLIGGGYSLKDIHSFYCSTEGSVCQHSGYTKYSYILYTPAYSILRELLGLDGVLNLHSAGFTPKELSLAGFSLEEIKSLGKTIYEYYQDTFTPKEILAMGFEKKIIKKELQKNGIEIKNRDFE